MFSRRDDDVVYISPEKEVNIGLWILFAGATIFLGLRLWCKFTRRTGLWYDDYILMLSWVSFSKDLQFCMTNTSLVQNDPFPDNYSSWYLWETIF